MRWLKKFALVLLNILIGTLLLVILLFRLPFFNFRESSEKQTEAITEFGQQTPRFHDYETELPDGKKRNIHYVHVGDESKPLLLLVHGSPGSSSAMNVYLADTNLTKVVQVVAVDRPGFGFSDFGKTEISLAYQSLALKPIVEKYGSNGDFWPADTVGSNSVNDPKKVRLYLFAALNGRHHVKSRSGVFVPFVAPDEDLRVEMLGCLLGASG